MAHDQFRVLGSSTSHRTALLSFFTAALWDAFPRPSALFEAGASQREVTRVILWIWLSEKLLLLSESVARRPTKLLLLGANHVHQRLSINWGSIRAVVKGHIPSNLKPSHYSIQFSFSQTDLTQQVILERIPRVIRL